MEDIRGPDIKELAEKDYIDGMKYKDIAAKYNVSLNTVKSWKQRYNWNKKSVHTKKEKVCIRKQDAKSKKNNDKEPIVDEVKEVLENTELTDKQRLFCIYYIKCFNATKAYKKAYGCSYEVALVNGSRLLGNAKVKEEVQKLKQDKLNRAMLSEDDIFQKYIDIAFADITDYLEFGQEEVPVMTMYGPLKDKETGEVVTKLVNTVRFKESSSIDGTIISEVKQGKDGASIKLQDKMKALQWLSDRMDLLTIETKIRIDNEKAKVQMAREKLDLEKSKVTGTDEEVGDDGFLEALKGEISEVWDNE